MVAGTGGDFWFGCVRSFHYGSAVRTGSQGVSCWVNDDGIDLHSLVNFLAELEQFFLRKIIALESKMISDFVALFFIEP